MNGARRPPLRAELPSKLLERKRAGRPESGTALNFSEGDNAMCSEYEHEMQAEIGDFDDIFEWDDADPHSMPADARMIVVRDLDRQARPIPFDNIRGLIYDSADVQVISVVGDLPDLTPETYAALLEDADAALSKGRLLVILTRPERIGHWRGYLGFRGVAHVYYSRAGRLPLTFSASGAPLVDIFVADQFLNERMLRALSYSENCRGRAKQ